jgi:hypothetical protein
MDTERFQEEKNQGQKQWTPKGFKKKRIKDKNNGHRKVSRRKESRTKTHTHTHKEIDREKETSRKRTKTRQVTIPLT